MDACTLGEAGTPARSILAVRCPTMGRLVREHPSRYRCAHARGHVGIHMGRGSSGPGCGGPQAEEPRALFEVLAKALMTDGLLRFPGMALQDPAELDPDVEQFFSPSDPYL
eukprot:8377646-Pyramimonas_sp.AAC.1